MSVSTLSAIEPIALIFKLNNKMVERSVEGITDDEFWRSLAGGNPIGWLLGHVTHTRAQILTTMGHTYDSGVGPLFKRGTPLHDPADYPSRAAIQAAWGHSRGHMRDAFASLTAEQLAGPPPPTARIPGADTLAGYLAFLAFHESYHVGQMGYVRRRLGHDAIAG